MPNWIEGTLKLRGKRADLEKFFETAIHPSSNFREEKPPREKFITSRYEEDYTVFDIAKNAWIEGTRRAFINDDCVTEIEDEEAIVCLPIRQAWSFDTDNWKDISKKYNLDVRLFGFEMGMQFCQEIEVINGTVTIDKDITYDDWNWECPMPLMGG